MADKKTRTFWIVPGVVNPETKQPIEFNTLEQAKAQAGGFAGIGAKTPVEVTEEMTEDGEYTQYVTDPQTGKRVQMGGGVDSKQLALSSARTAAANTAADNARADAARQPAPQTPDQARYTKAQADAAEAEAAQAKAGPETIRRPAPPDVRRDVPNATETVSKAQADYDRQVQGDQRQALIDLQSRTTAAETKAHQDALLRIEQEKWTHQQALDEYNKSLDAIRLQAQAEQNKITQRGQDITVRGQDVSAGVQTRGQDIGFQQSGGESAAATFRAMLPYMNAPGQVESTNSLMAGRGPVPTQPTPVPSPTAPWMQGAAAAQGMMPGQYVLPGAPPQVPAGQYQLPG
jgi:hypothetical protein